MTEAAATPPSRPPWRQRGWIIALMLFVVIGPLGLPLVWKHPRWSGQAKLALTAATLLYTLWLVTLTTRLAHRVLHATTALNALTPFSS